MSEPETDLAEYDRETAALVQQAAEIVAEAQAKAKESKAVASSWRKQQKTAEAALLKLIAERKECRGKPTLLDFTPTRRAPNDGWRKRDLVGLGLTDDTRKAIASFMVDNLGDLHDEIHAGQTFGLTLGVVSDIRAAIEGVIDSEVSRIEVAAQPTDPELWRQYPIERWQRFGLTAKDVERLAAGEVKRETGRRPIATVGDLSNFTAPTDSGYSRGYADVKGIGPGGADRISGAETKFWAWWRDKGELEFARERGLIREAVAGTDGGVSEARDLDGAGGDDPDAMHREAFDANSGMLTEHIDMDTEEGRERYAEICRQDAEARNNVDTPGEVFADFGGRR